MAVYTAFREAIEPLGTGLHLSNLPQKRETIDASAVITLSSHHTTGTRLFSPNPAKSLGSHSIKVPSEIVQTPLLSASTLVFETQAWRHNASLQGRIRTKDKGHLEPPIELKIAEVYSCHPAWF